MLNLFYKKSKNTLNLKENKVISQTLGTSESEQKGNRLGETRHYPPAIKEWFNSIYVFNKNYFFKSLPITDKIVNKLIKSYFNLNPDKPNRSKRYKRLSVKRIFTSRAEIKHTNNKVIITVYTYNRQKLHFFKKIAKVMYMYIEHYKMKPIKIVNLIENIIHKLNFGVFSSKTKDKKNISLKIIKIIKLYKKFNYLVKYEIWFNKQKNRIKRTIKKNNKRLFFKIYRNYYINNSGFNFISFMKIKKNLFLKKKLYNLFLDISNFITKMRENNRLFYKALNWKKDKLKKYKKQYIKNFISLLIKKEFKNVLLYQYYMAMLCFNNYKFKSGNLLNLKSILTSIYNKKVELNIINLKYLHLNSDIFSESIAKKLKNRSNRLLKVLKKALSLVKVPYLIRYFEERFESTFFNKNLKNDLAISYLNGDMFLNKEAISQSFSLKKGYALSYVKHKTINGVRLEGTGRLTRRLTASRSIFKFKYKGGLKNIDSSYKEKSAVILRGHVKSNVQYTNINSYTRNGSFGLKNWISSY